LRPFLLGSPAVHWVMVRRESRADLTNVLTELGFELNGDLPVERFH
jgi:hypothetical protein